MCLSRLDFLVQAYSQSIQAKGFSPVWDKIWVRTNDLDGMIMEQSGQDHWRGASLIGNICNCKQNITSQMDANKLFRFINSLQLDLFIFSKLSENDIVNPFVVS